MFHKLFSLLSTVLISALFLMGTTEYVHAYLVDGSIGAWVDGQEISLDDNYQSTTSNTSLDDWDSLNNTTQSAETRYFSNLATGLLGTYVSASDYAPDRGDYSFHKAEAVAHTSFFDRLRVTIPNDYYEDGLYVSLSGYLSGNLSASGVTSSGHTSSADISAQFAFGDESRTFDQKITDDSSITINESFTLTSELVAPGTTVEHWSGSLTETISVSADLGSTGQALHWVYEGAPGSSYALGDFYSTGGFTGISMAEEVSWESDSGVFLAQSSVEPIPIPGTFLLLGLGLILLVSVKSMKGVNLYPYS